MGILAFSTKFKSISGLELSDDNRCVTRIPTNVKQYAAHRYIIPDVEPVFKGKHCWRVQTINPNTGWIFWGISTPDIFTNCSYDKAFGIAAVYHQQWFPWSSELKANVKHNDITMGHFKMEKGEVDILFDVDKRELNICVVGQCEKEKEAKIWNVRYPDDDKYGWVPHINIYALRAEARIAKIPIEWYGEKEDNI